MLIKMRKAYLVITSSIILVIISIFVISQAGPKTACCVTVDGYCQDMPFTTCNSGDVFTFIGFEHCNQYQECNSFGLCDVRGKPLRLPKQYYECVSTCRDVGSCTGQGNDLTTYTGDFSYTGCNCPFSQK
jgi:hypothetical protein